ncbi:hypothetical protein M407DRAFT_32918 [Tulasnella calospora MUT 4182]|uniref:TRIP4/RQT4 C2HC5-type zinc finger domain-containing protein n=1 Tax=Tulasnella calospora MUT 4182 TaxID=1051891 RepID=A0A0C3PRY1_9AGAM|nr:hypothetical protein M407DRAFT_32918 [Tulasnella calospora MUT 4182]
MARSQGGKDPQHGHAHKTKTHASPEVQKIERLIGALEDGISDLPAGGGCFCMARKHGLSHYTPICPSCGLVLCTLHNPVAPCPFCQSPLLSPNDRNIVLVKLLAEKEEILRKEEKFRRREELEIQLLKLIADGGGEFPTLGPKGGSGTSTPHERPPPTPEPPTTRKVLSLAGKGGGTTLTTFTPKAPPPTARPKPPPPKVLSKEDLAEIERLKPVLCPPTEVPFVKDVPVDEERPWKNLGGDGLVYIPPEPTPAPVEETAQQPDSSKGKKKGKGKKGGLNGRTVPGAGPS